MLITGELSLLDELTEELLLLLELVDWGFVLVIGAAVVLNSEAEGVGSCDEVFAPNGGNIGLAKLPASIGDVLPNAPK